jgi:transposase
MEIVAIDLGKSKSVYCVYQTETQRSRFGKTATLPERIHDLLVEVHPDRVVLESGPSAGWVHDLSVRLGFETQVANTNHEAWKWRKTKRKTDKDDALKIAKMSAMNEFPTVHMPGPIVRQKRELIAYRQALVGRCVRIKNQIRSILDRQGIPWPSGKRGWTKEQSRQLEQMVLPWETVESHALWRSMLGEELAALRHAEERVETVTRHLDRMGQQDPAIQRLRTIPGVGARLAETVVACLDDPHRFKNGKAVGCYAGLTPRHYQSGSMNRMGRISGMGNRLLRSLLVEVSWLGMRHNPWMRQVYEQTVRGCAVRKKVAIVAVARRLLIRCWALLRDGSAWDPNRHCTACPAS